MLLHLMWHRSGRWISVLFEVGADNEEGHASEKNGPVADIQAAPHANAKTDQSKHHGRPRESAWPCLTALRTALPSCLPPCATPPLTMFAVEAAAPAPAKKEVQPWPPAPLVETPVMPATTPGALPIMPRRIALVIKATPKIHYIASPALASLSLNTLENTQTDPRK